MPVENPEPTPQEQPRDDWHQLARDAADHWDLEHPGVAALYENYVVPKLQDKGLGHLAITAEDKAGGRFVHKSASVDPKEVDHVVGYLRSNGEPILDNAGDRTATYLKFMADTAKDGILTGDPESVRRQIDAHVIKAENVPESHFALQRQIARNQGHGDIEITPDMKHQLIEAAQADQRASLEKWVEYLGGNDGSYPDWFKTYAWQGITRLGKYNKETQKFSRREADTVAPYPELSREALAYTYAAVKNFHVLGEKPDDAKLQQVLKEGSFGRLYTHAILEVTPDNPELRQDIRGSWTKYHQSADPRTARRLAGSLQGHGTDWCTAGEPTAAMQLQDGDFYVYYTRDEDGKDTIPRLAIRMENGVVSHDVRGVLPGQEVEPILIDVLSEKLQDPDLPGGKEYLQKAADMKRLTALDDLMTKNPDAVLSKDDLLFLYEFNRTIEGFGYDRDPRIDEIKAKRGERDLPEIIRMLPEVLADQTASSYQAYSEVAQATGAEVMDKPAFARLLETKLAEWQGNGTMDYVVRDFVENGNKPNLLATPNVIADWQTLRDFAVHFGEQQPYETFVYDELYQHYSAEELSGELQQGGAVRLSIMPSGYTKQLGRKPVAEQLNTFKKMQVESPSLKLRVPSVLDAVTYWQTLRARGDKLSGNGTTDKTWIRHFNLEPKRVDGWSGVPGSYVRDYGWPRLGNSDADGDGDARVSVG